MMTNLLLIENHPSFRRNLQILAKGRTSEYLGSDNAKLFTEKQTNFRNKWEMDNTIVENMKIEVITSQF